MSSSFGSSPGYLEARDILGAVDYVKQRGERAPIAVLGHSYGAVAALFATAQSPEIAAAISDGAFASGTELLANVTRYYIYDTGTPLWARTLLLLSECPGVQRATTLAYYLRTGMYLGPEVNSVIPAVTRIHQPVLFISGERDWISPTENARRMFSASPSTQKFLLVVPNAGHNTTYKAASSQYESAVLEFLAKTIRKDIGRKQAIKIWAGSLPFRSQGLICANGSCWELPKGRRRLVPNLTKF